MQSTQTIAMIQYTPCAISSLVLSTWKNPRHNIGCYGNCLFNTDSSDNSFYSTLRYETIVSSDTEYLPRQKRNANTTLQLKTEVPMWIFVLTSVCATEVTPCSKLGMQGSAFLGGRGRGTRTRGWLPNHAFSCKGGRPAPSLPSRFLAGNWKALMASWSLNFGRSSGQGSQNPDLPSAESRIETLPCSPFQKWNRQETSETEENFPLSLASGCHLALLFPSCYFPLSPNTLKMSLIGRTPSSHLPVSLGYGCPPGWKVSCPEWET